MGRMDGYGVQTRECDGVSRSKCGDEHANDRTMRERIRRDRKQWDLSYSVVDLVSPSREVHASETISIG